VGQIREAKWAKLEARTQWFDSATNRINSGGGMTMHYDLDGNLLQMGTSIYTYDTKGRMLTAANGSTTTYAYNGLGQRVSKTTGGQSTFYVYDVQGNLIAEYGAASGTASTVYLTTDHLGSTRAITDGSGTLLSRRDYLPFGEEIPAQNNGRTQIWGTVDSVTQKFTGQERDTETGFDFLQSRYFGSVLGRFTSPDEPFAGFEEHDPQSFNLYSYVGNNPLHYTDPGGHDVQVCVAGDDNNQKCLNLSDAEYKQLYDQQNGQQGIGLPGGTFPTGDITCGGQTCGSASYFEPSMQDDTLTVAMVFDVAGSLARGVGRAILNVIERDAVEQGGFVIGKLKDLNKSGALRQAERRLDLKELNNPKANWTQNASRLRQAMNEGKPIRDASAQPLEGGRLANNTRFLRAERNLLENHDGRIAVSTGIRRLNRGQDVSN
jgi:RHS repeat-associated protein